MGVLRLAPNSDARRRTTAIVGLLSLACLAGCMIADALHKANVQPEEAGLRMQPKQEMELNAEASVQVLKALESIEDIDDVQNVYSNLKVSDEALAALEAA